ncbi:pilus assembly protein FlpE, partial [Cellulomonas sp. P5_C6]
MAGRGGAGASTLAAALARQLARRTATALVDLDRASGGIDVLLGLESADGVRWPDLADARGEVAGADVLALLPRWGACAVLSADRERPGAPEPGVVADVLHALTGSVGALVLDLDRASVVAGESVAPVCDAVLVVAPRDLRTVAGILAMRPRLVGVPTWLVVRGPAPGGLGAAELSEAVGLPALGTLRADGG